MTARTKCTGPDRHCAGCRPGRPLCRWRRAPRCGCDAYHYPHRKNSGLCGDDERRNALAWGPEEFYARKAAAS